MQGEKGRKKAGQTKSPTDNIYLGKQTHEKVNGIFFFFNEMSFMSAIIADFFKGGLQDVK